MIANILKIAGALVAGLAGLIGILGQTRTQDNKLTRSGKWLFGMAIVGVMLAMSTQIWEWRKSIEDDRTARRENRNLLLKLDRQAQLAANSLHEVRRAVTRFQDKDISFNWSFSFDSNNEVFGPYIRDLAKLVEDATFEPPFKKSDWFAAAGNRGLRVIGFHPERGVSDLSIQADSPAMPDEGKYAVPRHYILEGLPEISLFKTPISPAKFFTTWPMVINDLGAPWNPLYEAPRPDLILKLKPGKVSITFHLEKAAPKVSSIRVEDSGIIASTFDSSGNIVSLEDLDGCQGIINLALQRNEFTEPWNTASNPRLECRVNNQPIKVSDLTSTQTGYEGKHDHLIYSFTLSALGLAKADH
jgi:hypothetical protein